MSNKYCLERHQAINENNCNVYFSSKVFKNKNSNIYLKFTKRRPILGKKKKNTFCNSLTSLHWLQNLAYFRLCIFILLKSNLLSSPPHTAKWEYKKHKYHKNAKSSKMSRGKVLEISHLNRILDKHTEYWCSYYEALINHTQYWVCTKYSWLNYFSLALPFNF